MTPTIKHVDNMDALRHPLYPIILAALNIKPDAIVDATPMSDSLKVTVLGDNPMKDVIDNPFYTHSVTDTTAHSEGPVTDYYFDIPAVLPVVLYKLQCTVQGVGLEEAWQDVLTHLKQPSVWQCDDVKDFERQVQAAVRVCDMAHVFFERADKARIATMETQHAQDQADKAK